MNDYEHTQTSPLCLILYGSAGVLFVGAWFAQGEPPADLILAGTGLLIALLGLAFHHLCVTGMGEFLSIHFGPLPLFRRRMRYGDIEKVEIGRTLLLDGWGIHMSVRGGWVWNLWGRDCVVVHLKTSVLRIGTDDAANLARFLEEKIGERE